MFENIKSSELSWWDVRSSKTFANTDNKLMFKLIFSTVEINYNPSETRTVTPKDVDEEIKASLTSRNNLEVKVSQVFIDTQNNDANE